MMPPNPLPMPVSFASVTANLCSIWFAKPDLSLQPARRARLTGAIRLHQNTNMKTITTTLNHPAISQTHGLPSRVSPRYVHIDTLETLGSLTRNGWQVDDVSAARKRNAEHIPYAAHMVRLSHPDLPKLGDSRIQAILMNSHDSSRAFRLQFGVFRFACLNGLICGASSFGALRLIHHGMMAGDVLTEAQTMISRAPALVEKVETFQAKLLTPEQELEIGRAHV